MITLSDDILYEINCAALRAIDNAINKQLGENRKYWIRDEHLPALLPAIERAVVAAVNAKVRANA